MFVLETSPGTEQQIGLIRPRDLKEGDRAGVIVFTRTVQLVQPLTENREDLAKALQLAGIRISIGVQRTVKTFPRPSNEPVSESQDGTVDLYGALRQACREFGDAGPEGPKHVIIVLAASEDPRLVGNLDSLKSLLAVSKARLFAIAITRGSERAYSFPVMTAQFLNQLAKDSGGGCSAAHGTSNLSSRPRASHSASPTAPSVVNVITPIPTVHYSGSACFVFR
jgi:hypothetical protein